MRILCYAAALLLIRVDLISDAAAENPASARAEIETIVFLRHGEKPQGGLGQLTCQGLNRALALPPILISKFGRADYVFAPAPEGKVSEGGLRQFDYIRPLATIEPTAIRLGLPVCTDFRYNDITGAATGAYETTIPQSTHIRRLGTLRVGSNGKKLRWRLWWESGGSSRVAG
jgi:hypothetical protein